MTNPEGRTRVVDALRAAGCVFAEDEAALLLAAASGAGLDELVARRVAGEPLEHLLGWVEFCGLRLAVGPGVFVPRQRTALLARLAVSFAREVAGTAGTPRAVGDVPRPVVVELCCGVAPVAAVALDALPGAVVFAADLDPVAVGFARRNLGDRAATGVGDLVAPVPERLRGRIDVLVVNTPYVPTAEIAGMPPEAREHEPRLSLDGGADGLDVQRRLAVVAPDWLAPGGRVLVEVSERQAPDSAALFAGSGLDAGIEVDHELAATAVVARRPS